MKRKIQATKLRYKPTQEEKKAFEALQAASAKTTWPQNKTLINLHRRKPI